MNKIESELSAEELKAFIEKCYQTEGLTLEKIQELAGGLGIEISLMSAKSFRDKNFAGHLKKLEAAAQLADQIEQLNDSDSGKTLADASAALISKEVFDLIANGGIGGEDGADLNTLSKIVSRLRIGDQRAKELQMKVDEFERTKAELLKIASESIRENDGGISQEAADRINKILRGEEG